MELQVVAQEISKKIKLLEEGRNILAVKAHNKANTIAEYDKAFAITIIKLNNGVEFDIDGNKVQNPKTSIMEKIAKGLCWKERLDMELADAEYKNAISSLDCLKTELNGYQSINRHLSEI